MNRNTTHKEKPRTMEIWKPEYFDTFHCIAAACPDSCCQEWDVDVDEASAEYYRSLPGPLGDRLRQVLKETGDGTVMTIEDGRCPMWRRDGLCRLQAELGEQALCAVCREYPRLRHDYGDFVELGLELSCPEAARILLNRKSFEWQRTEVPGGEPGDYEEDAMALLRQSRGQALTLLEGPPERALSLLLLYGYQVQQALDGGTPGPFDIPGALENIDAFSGPGDLSCFLEFFRGLEILTPRWRQRMEAPAPGPMDRRIGNLARYLTERYWLQAVCDYDLVSRVKLIVACCVLVASLGGELVETAQLFSKEIENDADNVDAILDAAYEVRAFADDRLLGMLQMGKGD